MIGCGMPSCIVTGSAPSLAMSVSPNCILSTGRTVRTIRFLAESGGAGKARMIHVTATSAALLAAAPDPDSA